MKRIIILGPQGSGKGTQAALLSEKLNIPALSMGQLLRDEIAAKTELGLEIESILDSGNLVSDEVAIRVLRGRLDAPDTANGYIIDGYPRNMEQYEASKALPEPTDVLVIEVPKEESLKRLVKRAELEGRADDTEVAINKRLEIYENQTRPLIDIYAKDSSVHRIDGLGSVEEIHNRIMEVID